MHALPEEMESYLVQHRHDPDGILCNCAVSFAGRTFRPEGRKSRCVQSAMAKGCSHDDSAALGETQVLEASSAAAIVGLSPFTLLSSRSRAHGSLPPSGCTLSRATPLGHFPQRAACACFAM